MTGTLDRLLRLRQQTVEQARRELALRRAAEAARQAALRTLEEQARRDLAATPALTAADPWFAALAACGRHAARTRRDEARQAVEVAARWADTARGDLAAARVAAETVLALAAERRAAKEAHERARQDLELLETILRDAGGEPAQVKHDG